MNNNLFILISLSIFLAACDSQTTEVFVEIPDVIKIVYPIEPTQSSVVPNSTKIAFFGDQGISSDARSVLELVVQENASTIIMLGDMGYGEETVNTSLSWTQMYDSILGQNYLTIGVIGNHDVSHWSNYESFLEQKVNGTDICIGEYGVKMTCQLPNIDLILSGIGTYGEDHEEYIQSALENSSAPWKICGWHKNQNKMQTGYKRDEVGWDAYEICRNHGAIIMTGHEHAYSRTHTLNSFSAQSIRSVSNNPVIGLNMSFAVVSGLGGYSSRTANDKVGGQDWWAKIYTADEGSKAGALFCSFPIDPTVKTAECYFKNIQNELVDKFTINRT